MEPESGLACALTFESSAARGEFAVLSNLRLTSFLAHAGASKVATMYQSRRNLLLFHLGKGFLKSQEPTVFERGEAVLHVLQVAPPPHNLLS